MSKPTDLKNATIPKAIDQTLVNQWLRGTLVADFREETDSFARWTAVVKQDGKYSIARFFTIGTSTHVSMDARELHADEIISRLAANLNIHGVTDMVGRGA